MDRRAFAHYVLSAAILAVYGGQVCPFLDSLSPITLLGTLLSGFLIAYGVRYRVFKGWMQANLRPGMPGRRFRTEFLLFVAVGAVITIFHSAYYGFPLGSGLKLMIGCITLGFFASIDLVLDQEYVLVKSLSETGRRFTLEQIRPSLAGTFTRFATVVAAGAITVLFLVLNKDLDWLLTFGSEGLPFARKALWGEILFVGVVILVQLIVVILSYSRNLRVFFDNETSVLDGVVRGKLDRYVPVATEDEFGLIASRTNEMIDGLRERNRLRDLFGKFLNPKIADTLLAQGEEGLKPGGSRRELVILVSDIRDFTSLAETFTPEQVVTDLNRYFSRMVEIVHRNQGVVDKFLGDGMLAYYGLDDPRHAAASALRSALEMQQAMENLRTELSLPFHIGIGLHAGEVIAGKIGSSEKLEFTVIGDAVNTATRLEGLCKGLHAAIVVSRTVLDRLPKMKTSLPWTALGEHKLKGKEQAVEVYAIKAADISPAMAALGSGKFSGTACRKP